MNNLNPSEFTQTENSCCTTPSSGSLTVRQIGGNITISAPYP